MPAAPCPAFVTHVNLPPCFPFSLYPFLFLLPHLSLFLPPLLCGNQHPHPHHLHPPYPNIFAQACDISHCFSKGCLCACARRLKECCQKEITRTTAIFVSKPQDTSTHPTPLKQSHRFSPFIRSPTHSNHSKRSNEEMK